MGLGFVCDACETDVWNEIHSANLKDVNIYEV